MKSQKRKTDYFITLAIVLFMIASAVIYCYTMATCVPELMDAGPMHRTILAIPGLGLIALALYIAIKEL